MRLLETHGCQGGAHAGYVRAGWDVTGVDIDRRHARYYPGKLIIADAATYIREHGHEYDAIHASPPCQWYTRGNAKGRATGNSRWARSIPPIRAALESTGRPYVIENVTDAGWDMLAPIALCGCMFSLSTIDTDGVRIHLKRERLFETNWGLTAPAACDHSGIEWFAGAYGGARRDKYEAKYVRRGGVCTARQGSREGAARDRARHDVERPVRVLAARVHGIRRRAVARPRPTGGRRMTWTASDYVRGVHAALRQHDGATLDALERHGPYADHCGGYEVLAWPCPHAARLLDDLFGGGA